MSSVQPSTLRDLFEVFPRLERGDSVELIEPPPEPVRRTVGQAFGLPVQGPLASPSGLIDRRLVLDSGRHPGRPPGGSRLGVRSSGSTGRPKLVWHHWLDLCAGVSRQAQFQGWTWAAPYSPASFAGVQVALQAWAGGGDIVSLPNWSEAWPCLLSHQVQALSCTPTFLDLLLQSEPPAAVAWQPRQITLGGEVLGPALGERLRARFPHARFTVIYAAAEFGVLLKTSRLDGWYESPVLEARYPQWRVVKGRLEVWRRQQWQATPDLVDARPGLIRVIGRADQVANVAGTKVNLAEIAALAERVPGVRRAVAVTEANPLTGSVVCLKYALEPGWHGPNVTAKLQEFLRRNLRKEAWPRDWVIDEVGVATNAKRVAR